MTRREHGSIAGDILEALADPATAPGPRLRLTHLATRANVAFDRLRGYIDELRRLGLVTGEGPLGLTDRGHEFLRAYRAWVGSQERFGLLPRPVEAYVSTGTVVVTDPRSVPSGV